MGIKGIVPQVLVLTIVRLQRWPVTPMLFACVVVAAFTYSLPLAASPKRDGEDTPCMSEKGRIDCLAQHIPGFGDHDQTGDCGHIVYLTDLKQKQAALAILEPVYRKRDPHCGARLSFSFKKGQYKFTELDRWKEKAAELLMRNEHTRIPSVSGFRIWKNRIQVGADKDDMIPRAKKVLRAHNIPVDAFMFHSREAIARRLASYSVAPVIRRGAQGESVIVPVFALNGNKVADFVMGESAPSEVLRQLFPFPKHGPWGWKNLYQPKKRPPWRSPEVHRVFDRLKKIYSVAGTDATVGFDKKEKLILIQIDIVPEQKERFTRELDAIAEMREVHRDSLALVRQRKLTPCVTIETSSIAWAKKGSPYDSIRASYFYTCKTKP